jgi:hypothetical protein
VTMKRLVSHFFLLFVLSNPLLLAIDNLKLNSKLDYTSDNLDGPLITGDDAQSGFVPGKPNYVIIYGEGCFNSKRQAQRTVELYDKYRSQVHFVVIDLDIQRSPEQQKTGQAVLQRLHPSRSGVGRPWQSSLQPSRGSGFSAH